MTRWKRQKGKCYFCKRKMLHPRFSPNKDKELLKKKSYLICTREHLTPLSDGGTGGNNIVLACWGCNRDKQNLNEQEYRLVLCLRKLNTNLTFTKIR